MGLKISGFLLSVDFPFLNGTALQFLIIINTGESGTKRGSPLACPQCLTVYIYVQCQNAS